MSKYSRYTKHSSGNDFLNILGTSSSKNTTITSYLGAEDTSQSIDKWNFDFSFNITTYLFWFMLFTISYSLQPLVIWKLLPKGIKNQKKGTNPKGESWIPDDFKKYSDDILTRKKMASEANKHGSVSANERFIGARVTTLFVISMFTYIFGNWYNNIDIKNKKIKIVALVIGCLSATFGFEMLKSFANIQQWVEYFEKSLQKDSKIKGIKEPKILITLAIILFFVFIIPLGYGLYKSIKGGFVSYYVSLFLIFTIIFCVIPMWVSKKMI